MVHRTRKEVESKAFDLLDLSAICPSGLLQGMDLVFGKVNKRRGHQRCKSCVCEVEIRDLNQACLRHNVVVRSGP